MGWGGLVCEVIFMSNRMLVEFFRVLTIRIVAVDARSESITEKESLQNLTLSDLGSEIATNP